jgi:glycine oxidase
MTLRRERRHAEPLLSPPSPARAASMTRGAPPRGDRLAVTVVGAGVAGLVAATELAERGVDVEILERGRELGARAASWFAGGMLAPYCERESAEEAVSTLGARAIAWWARHLPDEVARNGTLVVAQPRDVGELDRFSRRTHHWEWADAARIAALEPDLGARFRKGLFFPDEAHVDPRRAMTALARKLEARGVRIRYDVDLDPRDAGGDRVLDARGFAAKADLPELRGVRGEMAILRCKDVKLSRAVRLLHPRIPLYVVPREDHLFMIGATMIESADAGPITVRSAVDLLNAAYALHPAFGEAEVVEFGVDIRPSFPDNLPRLIEDGRVLRLNGMYRHGYLLAPEYARRAAEVLLGEAREAVA